MSEYPYDRDDAFIPSNLSGAHRPSANPRLHTVSKPYSRPSSYSGPSSQVSNGNGNGRDPSPTKALTRTTRSQLPTSNSSGILPRSGSDSSLFSGLKSIFSRPLQWLATPSRGSVTPGGTKRDSCTTFGQDVEDPESPTDRHEGKRARRSSPKPVKSGDYEPRLDMAGRAVSGFMLPPLPPNLTLAPRFSGIDKPLLNRTNFSRPLTIPTSKSMPYLDPPKNLLASPARRGMGSISRSRRMDLVGFGDEDEDMGGSDNRGMEKGKEKEKEETRSLWKNGPVAGRNSMTPKRGTPSRIAETRDVRLRPNRIRSMLNRASQYILPSLSPFKPPPSPSSIRPPTPSSALGQSPTTLRRAASVLSDVSMGQESVRGARKSSSMLFGSIIGERENQDERMSVDGDRHRDARNGSGTVSVSRLSGY